ncbi:MAG: 50S ribosomal protein L35 [Candidatus Omnitrophica bacterium]|nr:50S ribosomal protein L35 [Candidatus Omnitrophota bacterium]
MPKIKTVKGVKARVKVTGRGRVVAFRSGRRHLLGGKRAKTKRQLRRQRLLAPADARKVLALIPYHA